MQATQTFLKKNNLLPNQVDIDAIAAQFIAEMHLGLNGEQSSLRMIPTYIEAENKYDARKSVLAIDAGGTNFRAAVVSVSPEGEIIISDPVHAGMPGLICEISKEEFFNTLAGYIRPLAEKVDAIGFCFSYPTEILPGKDGRLLQFCKEVKAPEVVGELVGANLLQALGMPDKPIVLLNDTVATLLAGKLNAEVGCFDSYIGYILGTGTNTCYIENNRLLSKIPDIDQNKAMIINIESGAFAKAPRTEVDLQFDQSTNNPGQYTFEKMVAGGYFGALLLYLLKKAAAENLFAELTASKLRMLNELTTEQANNFLIDSDQENPLLLCMSNLPDKKICEFLIQNMIERSARLVAANLAAVVLKTDKGKTEERPILITVEGSTFYKLKGLQPLVDSELRQYLSGSNQRFFQIAQVDQSSLVGAALAALMN